MSEERIPRYVIDWAAVQAGRDTLMENPDWYLANEHDELCHQCGKFPCDCKPCCHWTHGEYTACQCYTAGGEHITTAGDEITEMFASDYDPLRHEFKDWDADNLKVLPGLGCQWKATEPIRKVGR